MVDLVPPAILVPKGAWSWHTRLVRARPNANLKSLQARLLRIAIFVCHVGPMMPVMGEDILSKS